MSQEYETPEADWRCDICTVRHSVSPIRWTYRTADSLDAEQRARLLALPGPRSGLVWAEPLPGETPGFVFEDPEWAVCQPCHELICDGDLYSLIARNVEMQGGAAFVVIGGAEATPEVERLIVEAQETAAAILTAFWTHRVGDPEPVAA